MSCRSETFLDVATERDPFEKLQKFLAESLKGHAKEQQVLGFLANLRDVSRNYNSMSQEEKQLYAADFLRSARNVVDDIKSELMKKAMLNKLQDPKQYFLVAVVALVILFAFFGYKLYKSLTEKERKREEKAKAKQAKKKK